MNYQRIYDELISNANMSTARKGENNHFYGKNHTEETKNKIRKAHLGKYGRPVMATCIKTGMQYTFPTANYAAKEDTRDIGRDSSSISKACRGLIKHHNGYTWEFADVV